MNVPEFFRPGEKTRQGRSGKLGNACLPCHATDRAQTEMDEMHAKKMSSGRRENGRRLEKLSAACE
jgi:hypothetical protein